jgi:hypothetical protein
MGRLAVEAIDRRRAAPDAPARLQTVTPHLEVRSSSRKVHRAVDGASRTG